MTLKKKLSQLNQENKGIDEYLQVVKSIADELARAQASVDDDDIVKSILNGLNLKFHEISTALRARETSISYEELHENLTDFEAVLKQQEAFHITVNFAHKTKG